ncbi:fimbrial protein [Enterobacter chuandaensis]|uniref:Fimbrial protein n=1 Tax=Enterobacter chuandaensis TaxID=2497875 RepID=A0AA96M5M1_9ENTR|nr:fimbrial protein [Enterobacter chuandaensis]MCW4781582.1 fimbrial protein [Enterobacter chuandaensis]MDA4759434.1 fimbrial protein [Enterobacter chuandaensis]WNS39355.1 fimbrial protein [Enterobacter chuandaensis]
MKIKLSINIMWPVSLLMSIVSFLMSSQAFAGTVSCSANTGAMVLNTGNVIVQRDASVGTIITNKLTSQTVQTAFTCFVDQDGVAPIIRSMLAMNALKSNGLAVFNTTVPGIGVMIGFTSTMNGSTSSATIGEMYSWSGPYWTNNVGYWTSGSATWSISNVSVYVQLVVTAQPTSGVLSGYLADVGVTKTTATNDGSGYPLIPVSINGTVTRVACAITTPNLTFPIGDVLASNFGNAVGVVPAGAQNTQNLGLNCDAGANINISLAGTQNPDVATNSVLALTNQGNTDVAKGVGVQLLYNGSPLVLNNRIVLKQSSGGQESFPITARYYQTKTAVTTGKANASATLNLTYQ